MFEDHSLERSQARWVEVLDDFDSGCRFESGEALILYMSEP